MSFSNPRMPPNIPPCFDKLVRVASPGVFFVVRHSRDVVVEGVKIPGDIEDLSSLKGLKTTSLGYLPQRRAIGRARGVGRRVAQPFRMGYSLPMGKRRNEPCGQ